ncbi:MAG: M48 family metallopeptidase [Clostridia bacterium]|nr:M48 family metallopeptidase [Clostridia bacterium]
MTEFEYKIIKSDRRTLSIEIKNDGSVLVRAPRRMNTKTIDDFVNQKRSWIVKHIQQAKNKLDSSEELEDFSKEDLNELNKKLRAILPNKLEYYSKLIGVEYYKVSYRCQKTRWGSCSSKNNLNFNILLAAMPEDILDYVVVHELCHIKQHNHSKKFWNEVEKIIPDYKLKRNWLKENGNRFINSVRQGGANIGD